MCRDESYINVQIETKTYMDESYINVQIEAMTCRDESNINVQIEAKTCRDESYINGHLYLFIFVLCLSCLGLPVDTRILFSLSCHKKRECVFEKVKFF